MDQETKQRLANAQELNARQTGDQIGIRNQQEETQKRKYNPGFYREIADPDTDTQVFPWVRDELGPELAKPHILGDRDRSFIEQSELLDMNKAERMISEGSPGRLLKKNPLVNAIWQGLDSPSDDDFEAPIERQSEKRAYRSAMQLSTTRKSLGVEGRGLDALTKATTETTMRKDKEEKSRGWRTKLSGVAR